jgi:hypothetical protein
MAEYSHDEMNATIERHPLPSGCRRSEWRGGMGIGRFGFFVAEVEMGDRERTVDLQTRMRGPTSFCVICEFCTLIQFSGGELGGESTRDASMTSANDHAGNRYGASNFFLKSRRRGHSLLALPLAGVGR